MNTDYYTILGVEETATQDEIKKAYRNLAKENHPDKGGDEELFKQISVAYDIIGDEEKRQRYDIERKNPFKGTGGGFETSFQEMFNSVFNQKRQQRTHTTNITINVGVLESYFAQKKNITFKRKTNCETCSGSGGDKRVCPTCNGAGQTLRQVGNGMFIQMVSVQCNGCGGFGYALVNPCFVCSGNGTKDEMKNIEIKIPHGIDDGQFLRLQSMGDFRNGVFGDLIVRVNIEKENNFQKYENNLVYDAYFDLEDLKKESFEIPHPDGLLTVKFPKIIDTSKPLRIKSKGFRLGSIGDLLVNQFVKFHRD